ncbi:Heterokaryon incompatibility protein 6, OR allele [Colletotrichum fructicola Nara gc5]|uniref:Heterokaryon incompatibility protein 6, OR allele n=1 Tax=Colletotrichum fructicola (strain Nara gc5) TaxID=1213859 RepID=A0A7J6JAG1_COLFN|nr:Heterokaryon incompatibility protein 6, OR allele [Colletotrichum fructicola Nara gc5]
MFGPYYYAISYVWGTNVKSKVILCNDKTTYITPNLFEALHQIRDHVGQQIVLWADSLCINQDDEEEKSHQVALMGQIHARASRVLIHLGGGDNGHARKAGSLIRERDAYVRQNLSLLAGIRSLWYGFPRLSTEERDNITNDERWEPLNQMLSQPWFNRGWVIQEAALGQSTDVLWGGEIIAWEQLIRCAAWVCFRCIDVEEVYMCDRSNIHCHIQLHLERYLKEAAVYRYSTDQLDIAAILNLARETDMTNPKDRIFAFLSLGVFSHEGDGGIYKERPKMRVTYLSLLWLAPLPVMLVFIATNWSRISAPEAWSIAKRLMWAVLGFLCITYPEGLVPLFLPFLLVLRAFSYALFATILQPTTQTTTKCRLMKPDYGKTKEEVYTDFARQRILLGDIRILHFAQEHSSEERGTRNALPSWVPRWDLRGDDVYQVPNPWQGRPLSPSQGFDGSLTRAFDGTKLTLTGVVFDRVRARASFLKPKPELSAVAELLTTVHRMNVGNAYPPEQRLAVMIDCLCEASIPFDVDFTAWAAERQALVNLLQSCDGISLLKACEEEFPIFHKVLKRNEGGSPFFTDRGFFGMAYTQVAEGDVCAIVFGCGFHFILRPTVNPPGGGQPHYRIVGSALIVDSQEDVAIPGQTRPLTGAIIIGRKKGSKDWVKWGLREQEIFIL